MNISNFSRTICSQNGLVWMKTRASHPQWISKIRNCRGIWHEQLVRHQVVKFIKVGLVFIKISIFYHVKEFRPCHFHLLVPVEPIIHSLQCLKMVPVELVISNAMLVFMDSRLEIFNHVYRLLAADVKHSCVIK